MKRVKLWMTSIGASFDGVMKQIENQEAVAAQAIEEARKAAGEAKIRLNRVRRDGENLRKRIGELELAETSWTNRAKATGNEQRERALECMRRLKHTRQELQIARAELARHETFERKLGSDIQALDARIEEFRRKKNALAAREHRSRATHASDIEQLGGADIEDVFERWEDRLVRHETFAIDTGDTFESEFTREEETASLDAELDALLATDASTNT